jgi:1-deoxy-D-xylulose-5-phosphate reductoisomerase
MGDNVKRLAILGSTGSIGRQTLDVVRAFPDKLRVVALAAGSNAELLLQQVNEFAPKFVSLADGELTSGVDHLSIDEIAAHAEVDLVVIATAGKAGLAPTLAAIRSGKQVALANKEVLVMAGEIVMAEARAQGVQICPVDSEHSAIWQCLGGEQGASIDQIVLTASGGPFRHLSIKELSKVTARDALRHPTWQMGRKVTVDSATLMNKGMEIIEARWLFDIPVDKIEVLIHPESIIHSMVEFADGSVKAQLGYPDMRLPIQYAISYPERWSNHDLPRIDFSEIEAFHFEQPDMTHFPCLRLAIEAIKKGGTYPSVLSAADEVAVGLFLDGRIGLTDIPRLVEKTLSAHRSADNPALEQILAADGWAREHIVNVV